MHCLNRERREKDRSKKGTNESDERYGKMTPG
jgi:hypothetical protein